MSHLRYSVKRLLQAIPVLLGITSITSLSDQRDARFAGRGDARPDRDRGDEMKRSARYGFDQPLRSLLSTSSPFSAAIRPEYPLRRPRHREDTGTAPSDDSTVGAEFHVRHQCRHPAGHRLGTPPNQPIDHGSRVVSLVGVSTRTSGSDCCSSSCSATISACPSNGLVMPFTPIRKSGRGLAARRPGRNRAEPPSCLPSRWGLSKWRPSPRIERLDAGGARAGLHQPLARAFGVMSR